MSTDTFIGRQPIFDRSIEVAAYELLYRGGEENRAGVIDGDEATSRVIVTAFSDFDIDALVGHKRVFLNVTRDIVLDDVPRLLPPDKLTLEILEDTEVDDAFVKALEGLKSDGYQIALDDWSPHARTKELLPLADVVKVDVREYSPDELADEVSELRKSSATLLAEKVETRTELDYCLRIGFQLAQGFFLSRPEVHSRRSIEPATMDVLRLVARLQDPDVEIAELAEIAQRDVSLSYRLLRVVNSSHYGLPRRIESVREAITALGIRQMAQWIMLIKLADIHTKPADLMTTAMVRARFCENVALQAAMSDSTSYFTVGLFSVLDALLDAPMPQILEELPLADTITDALLGEPGDRAAVLSAVIAYERGLWGDVVLPHGDTSGLVKAYVDAIDWSDANQLM